MKPANASAWIIRTAFNPPPDSPRLQSFTSPPNKHMSTTEISHDTVNLLSSRINAWLTRQCDHASVRRALRLPSTGRAIITRIRGAYWVGTIQQEYCLKLWVQRG